MAAAVRALSVLATSPRGMATSAEIADAIGSHPVVVRRLLGSLRSSGLVESRSGPRGGWAIAKDPATILLGDVHRALTDEADAPASALDELLTAADAHMPIDWTGSRWRIWPKDTLTEPIRNNISYELASTQPAAL